MNKYEIVKIIEDFAPPETAENWDLSGWIVDNGRAEIRKIMLCLTLTPDIIRQAQNSECDMIISHHPLFFVPFEFHCGVNLYCAHTNLDKAQNGTTETLIKTIGFKQDEFQPHEYLRFCTLSSEVSFSALTDKLKTISNNIRYTSNLTCSYIRKIAFCSGSGTEFWADAQKSGANVFVTGNLKFHTALDTKIPIIDIGHFESEISVLNTLKQILGVEEILTAQETSPIVQV